jgi:hypothetical protein
LELCDLHHTNVISATLPESTSLDVPCRLWIEYSDLRGENCVRVISVLVLGIAVTGCSIAEKISARSEHQEAADSYNKCMAANPTAPKQCENLRLSAEALERKRDSISTDLSFKPGTPPPDFAKPQ